jgi:hypothetical protein
MARQVASPRPASSSRRAAAITCIIKDTSFSSRITEWKSLGVLLKHWIQSDQETGVADTAQ